MEDDNLILLLNTTKSESTTPIQQKREPLVEIAENDDHDSVVTMTCLNDRIPSVPPNSSKRHFDDIKLIRPSSATSQSSRSKRQEKVINYAPHLTSGGNRNSTDNLIQSSIDVTLSSNSSRDELQHNQRQQQRPPILPEEELAIVTIVGVEDNGERENENSIDMNDLLSTPYTPSQPVVPSQVHSTPDVQISRFDKDPTTSKAAFARSQLAKRFSINQAQQRHIPIQSLSNTTNNDCPSTNDQQQTATSLAATLAASVAVSVAQPFLKLQNELEQKMNTVLDQIHQQQQRAHTSGVVVPVTTVQQPNESNNLLNDCVDTRMKYMEKVQVQQHHMLKQLVGLVQTTKPKSKSPVYEHRTAQLESDSPQRHFLDTLVGTSSPPVRLTKSHKKHQTHKKTSISPSSSSPNKRPSRVTGTNARTGKSRSPVTFKKPPPNNRFNVESSLLPYGCSVCDRSRSRSRSRSPAKGLSPDSSYPRPYVPVPRPPSIMSDGFIPSSTTLITGNALHDAYPPFDRYLNNSMPPSPLQPKPTRPINDNLDLHERIKQIDEAKQLLDENYFTLQRRKHDVTALESTTNESLRVQRLVEQCVKQVTRQVREEVQQKLEQDEIQNEQPKLKQITRTKKKPTSSTQLAFERHSTSRAGQQTNSTVDSTTSGKPYSDVFMEAVYGRSLYQKIKKEGKQPYFKLKNKTVQQPKQPKQIEQIPVRDTGLKPSPRTIVPPRRITEQPTIIHAPVPPPPQPVYEPKYYTRPDGVILLGPPQIRDTRTFQPTYMPSTTKLTPHVLPSVDVDPSATKVRFGNRTESIRFGLDDNENDEDEDDDDGHGIEIPGYHGSRDDHQQSYDGPKFPPTIPHDAGYCNRQYDTLQSGAIDWLEQELIARFMSQLQNQQTTISVRQHHDVVSARSSTSTSSDDRSIHDRLLDLLGRDGFQLFIDMGQPIDQDLIQALTREVLEERITQMIGFRSPRESIHVVQPPPAPPPRTITPTTTTSIPDHHHQHQQHYQWPQDTSVPTPQPTPPHSPPPPTQRPRVVTPEITAQELSSESEPTTPRSVTPREDTDRPLPTVFHHSIGTPEPSDSPSPPSTPRIPQPPIILPPRIPTPPPVIEKRDASTMATMELPPPPPPVIIPTPPPPPRRQPSPPKPRTPSPVSSTSSSSSSSSASSTSLSTFSIPYSPTDSSLSDHRWFDHRSEGEVDLLSRERPQTDLIMRQVQRILDERRRYSSVTPVGMSSITPPFSPAGGTHTLSIGEVPPQFPGSTPFQQTDNGHTTPSGSDESNNSGKSEGEVTSSMMMMHQQPQSIHIKYRKPSQGFLGKKNNRK
ncbi:hypothetical protein I4U23_007735 [Adineta vaga]|nr:hypothetical protein I4U23_007735 [Adineta vaga]